MPKKSRSGYSLVFLFTLLALLEFPVSTSAQSIPAANNHPTTLIDDFEDQKLDFSPQSATRMDNRWWLSSATRTNLWGGKWKTTYTDRNSIGVTYTGTGHDSGYSAGVTGSVSGPPGAAIYQCPLTDWNQSFNAACHGLIGVQFWMKGDGHSYWVQVPDKAVTDLNWYGFLVVPSPETWTFFQIPFQKMRRQSSWGTQFDLPEHPDGSNLTGIQFFPMEPGDFAYSLDQIAFYGNYIPDCVASSNETTIASAPVPTATPLGNGCPPLEIDDFENSAANNLPAARVNLLGGKWTTVASPGGGVGVTYGSPGAEGSNLCANVTGNVAGDAEGDDASFQTTLNAEGTPFNAVEHGLGGIQFWMKGDGQPYWFNLLSRSVTDATGYSCYLRPAQAGVWTFFQIPFKEMVRQSWWEHRSGSGAADGNNVTGIGFMAKSKGPFAFSVDQVGFYCSNQTPTPTPAPTNTFTPQIPPTAVPTWTPRPIPTFTPWVVPTATPFVLKKPKPKPFFTTTPSPTALEYPRPTPLKLYPTRVPRPLAAVPPAPRPTPIHLPPLDPNVAVVFYAPPANINVTFADGPGRYQMEVVDSVGNSLESIFDQTVSYTSSTWVEWDGLDEKGKTVPPGQYYAVLYKDGKALRSISIVRIPPNP